MDPLPESGRCTCGGPIGYVRATKVGESGYFYCRACRKPYRETQPWTPGPGDGPVPFTVR